MCQRSVGMVLLAALLLGMFSFVGMTAHAADGEKVIVNGKFEWTTRPGFHDLKGTLTPTGENQWNVAWSFKWNGKATVYQGVVKGDLMNGEVSGTGNDAQRNRSFSFKGTAKDGTLQFTHSENTRGKSKATGTGHFAIE